MENKQGNPIKEIILNISFDSTLDVAMLENFCQQDIIKNDFQHTARGYDATLIGDGDKPVSEFKHTGYILRSSENSKSVLNLMLGKLSYHLLDKYEDFGNILDKLDLYWNTFQQTLGEVNVSLVSVRYINLIRIDRDEKLEDYLQVTVKAPFSTVQGQLVNFTFYPKDGNRDIKGNVTIANNQDNNLILDTIVEKQVSLKKVKNISDLFIELRPIKNNIFNELITSRTKERFEL